MTPSRLLLTALAALLLGACGTAPSYADGEVDGTEFSVSDEQAEVIEHNGDTSLVIHEDDGERLRVVELQLRDIDTLPLDKDVAMGPGVELIVTVGALEEQALRDGGRMVNTTDSRRFRAESGVVRLLSRDPLAVWFEAELDGGHVSGVLADD